MNTPIPQGIAITPPPTPNGRLHIGHVGGPFLRADIFVKLNRFLGKKIAHISHLDSYQTYVYKKSQELSRDIQEFLKEAQNGIKKDFLDFKIDHTLLMDNESPKYLQFLSEAISRTAAVLPLQNSNSWQCSDCKISLVESFVRGFCKNCHHESYENVCENCCFPQRYELLINPYCTMCGSRSHEKINSSNNLVIRFDDEIVQGITRKIHPKVVDNARGRMFCQSLGSHEVAWNLPVDYGVQFSGIPGVLNPWIEIYFAHLYSVLQVCNIDLNLGYEKAVQRLRNIHQMPPLTFFFGLDNTYYYSFLFPYLSQLLNLEVMMPSALLSNHFMQIKNSKISSSRNNVIWAEDIQARSASIQELRRQLAQNCPEGASRNFQNQEPMKSESRNQEKKIKIDTARIPEIINRLKYLAHPTNFSVERVMDVLDRNKFLAQSLAETGDKETSMMINEFLRELAAALDLS